MGVYLAIYDAIVTKLTDAKTAGTLTGIVKLIIQGDTDKDLSNSTPALIVMTEENPDERWTSLPKRRQATMRYVVRCLAGEKEVNSKIAIRGTLELAELVANVLDVDPGLSATVEIMNITIREFRGIGSGKVAFDVVVDTQKSFKAGLR